MRGERSGVSRPMVTSSGGSRRSARLFDKLRPLSSSQTLDRRGETADGVSGGPSAGRGHDRAPRRGRSGTGLFSRAGSRGLIRKR